MKTPILIIDKSETLYKSLISDSFTFSLLFVLMYFSSSSVVWSVLAIIMFILFMAGKIISGSNKRSKQCQSKNEAIAFIRSLPD